MIKRSIFGLVAACMLVGLVGCSSGGGEMSKDELDALKNPPKTIPPAAIEGMKKQGELQQKQMQQNAADGVDSRGVPLSKSVEKGAAPGGQ